MILQSAKRWKVYEPAPAEFLRSLPESALLGQILYNRGLHTASDAQAFLRHEDAVTENPFRLRDMQPAVQRILQAIEHNEPICVYGDFDADGVSATALLVSALQAAGGRVGPYIPDRVDEGYGLNLSAIDRIAKGAKLLITVDCGIRSIVEVERAIQVGLEVIITDHHSVGPHLPPALAVINPQRADDSSASKRLAGVGVAYRLAQAVLRSVVQQKWSKIDLERAEQIQQELLDFVALGTVADVMPLLGENRSLVRRGLAQINQTQRPGLLALMTQADIQRGAVDATAIAFRLGPRINAAGRLASAKLAYDLLRINDADKAWLLANELGELNQRRQNLTDAAQTEAEAQVAALAGSTAALYLVHSANFMPGIVGLVAGKLTDRFYRPAVVIERGESESRGSARSIPEFDISAALDEVQHLLVRHGGHSRAAGFTIQSAMLPEFGDALQAVAQRELGKIADLRPTLEIDAEVSLEQINWATLEQFGRLEPTGQENPAPLLLARQVRVREARSISSGKHIKLGVDGGARTHVFDAVAFHQGEKIRWLPEDVRIDIVFQLEANEWNGRKILQLNIQDLAHSEGQG